MIRHVGPYPKTLIERTPIPPAPWNAREHTSTHVHTRARAHMPAVRHTARSVGLAHTPWRRWQRPRQVATHMRALTRARARTQTCARGRARTRTHTRRSATAARQMATPPPPRTTPPPSTAATPSSPAAASSPAARSSSTRPTAAWLATCCSRRCSTAGRRCASSRRRSQPRRCGKRACAWSARGRSRSRGWTPRGSSCAWGRARTERCVRVRVRACRQ